MRGPSGSFGRGGSSFGMPGYSGAMRGGPTISRGPSLAPSSLPSVGRSGPDLGGRGLRSGPTLPPGSSLGPSAVPFSTRSGPGVGGSGPRVGGGSTRLTPPGPGGPRDVGSPPGRHGGFAGGGPTAHPPGKSGHPGDGHYYHGGYYDHRRYNNWPAFVVAPYWYAGWPGLYWGWPWGGYYNGYAYYGGGWPDYTTAVTVYSNPEVVMQTEPVAPPETPAPAPTDAPDTTLGEQFATRARESFRAGDYRDALRLANHAAIESPRDAGGHELMSLALFALKEYRGAAIEAHAAVSLGRISDWPAVYAYYQDAEKYTEQFRALEKHVAENPKSPEGRFLLGYHCVVTGNKEAARKNLTEAVQLVPKDEVAKQLLQRVAAPASEPIPPPPAEE
jgi:hypothetical protein